MAILGSDVLGRAREVLNEFDTHLIVDARLFTELSDETEKLVEEIILWNNPAFPIPTDDSEIIDVSTYAASYDLHENFWRPRRATLNYASGQSQHIQLVPENVQYQVPLVTPSAVIKAAKIFPIDGTPTDESGRIYGWTGAASITLNFATKPAAVTQDSDPVQAPDEAVQYLAYWLAHFMAVRAKAGEATVAIGEKVALRKQELRERVIRYGGPMTWGNA